VARPFRIAGHSPAAAVGYGPRVGPGEHALAGLVVTSLANARVKQLVALRRHRRARDQSGLTLAEGYLELSAALSAGAVPHALYHCPELAAGDPHGLAATARERGAEVVRVSRAVFEKVAYRESPDGWLAVLPMVPAGLGRLRTGPRALVLVCVGLEKPGNLGAILRTADAVAAAAVVAADPATDWGNPNVVRASKGTLFGVPVASGTSAEVMGWLADQGLPIVATSPGATLVLAEADLTGPVAITVGSESQGLPQEWLSRASTAVRIPMLGRADSLNVATTAAIVAYEAVRQRTARGVAQSYS
jgi:TrmH family RNA methyltransferase